MKVFWKKDTEPAERTNKAKFYLIRHGQTDWNVQGKLQGSHDIPLNGTGRRQAALLAEGMEKRPVKKIFSSTLQRAVETARFIGDRQNVDVYLVPALVEVGLGKWEGMTWEEVERQYPEEYARWNKNPLDVAPPGGENQIQAMDRCTGAMKTVLSMTDGHEDIAIVSHGATLAYVVAYFMRNHPSGQEIIVENASITTVEYDPETGDFILLESNDTSHLSVPRDKN